MPFDRAQVPASEASWGAGGVTIVVGVDGEVQTGARLGQKPKDP